MQTNKVRSTFNKQISSKYNKQTNTDNITQKLMYMHNLKPQPESLKKKNTKKTLGTTIIRRVAFHILFHII